MVKKISTLIILIMLIATTVLAAMGCSCGTETIASTVPTPSPESKPAPAPAPEPAPAPAPAPTPETEEEVLVDDIEPEPDAISIKTFVDKAMEAFDHRAEAKRRINPDALVEKDEMPLGTVITVSGTVGAVEDLYSRSFVTGSWNGYTVVFEEYDGYAVMWDFDKENPDMKKVKNLHPGQKVVFEGRLNYINGWDCEIFMVKCQVIKIY